MWNFGGVLGLVIASFNVMILVVAYLNIYLLNLKKKRAARLKRGDEYHRNLVRKTFHDFHNVA